jgi:hypothetical protein
VDGLTAAPLSYDFGYTAVCELLQEDAAGNFIPQPASSTAPFPDGVRLGNPFLFVNAEEATGIQCDRAYEPGGNPAWVPVPPVMTPVYVGFGMEVVTAPEGGLVDYWWDSNLDSVDEPYSASVVLTFYDSAFAPMCTMSYEADGALEVNPGTWTSMSGGDIWRAWRVNLVDGDSQDCTEIDPAVFGTANLQNLFSGLSFGFGIGEMVDTLAPLQTAYGANWATYEPFLNSVYITLNGTDAYEWSYGGGVNLNDCLVLDDGLFLLPTDTVRAGLPSQLIGLPVFVVVL